MTQDLVSSAPGIYEAFCKKVKEATEALSESAAFFEFEPFAYVPARYVIASGIENHVWDWEGIGTFEQKEHYSLFGFVTIFTGDSPATNPTLAISIMNATYKLFQEAVMTPVITFGRNEPILGTTGPSPYLMLPGSTNFMAAQGMVDGAPAGWQTRLDYTFNFSAVITPQ